MGCADIPDWYLSRQIPVVDLRSATWAEASGELLPAGYEPTTCLRRLATAYKVRFITRGLWQVVDPSREPPMIALADAIFRETQHYITTDAALQAEGLVDQPVPLITVVTRKRRRPLEIGHTTVRAVSTSAATFEAAESIRTSRDGYKVTLATPAQAVADAVAEPHWMLHSSLLPEVLAQLRERDVETAADLALTRSKAAAARLGYLLDEARVAVPADLRDFEPQARTELVPGRRGPYSTRWRVYG